jgi:HPt (histidine-containing phosphotransfer) domain-containing protein
LDSPKNEEPVIESLGRDWLGESLMPVPESTPEPDPVSPFSPQPDDAPLADLEASLFRFSNDRDFMKEMAAEFRDHLPARIDEFDAALQAGNIQDLGRLAHNLKGVCLNFNARRLADASAQLELCGKREDLSDAPALVELVKTEIKRLKEYLDLQLK